MPFKSGFPKTSGDVIISLKNLKFTETLGVSFNGLRLYPLNLIQLILSKEKVAIEIIA